MAVPRRLALTVCAVAATVCMFHGPAIAAGLPARTLASDALRTMGAGRDVATLPALHMEGREIVMDVVENDHPLTPPFYNQSVQNFKRDIDYAHGIQRTTVDGAQGGVALLSHNLAISFAPGAPAANRRIALPPPAWQSRDPVSVLRMALAASDLATAADVTWHGALQHVVAFHDGPYPIKVYIDAATGLPSASEATVAYDDQHIAGSIAWNAMGDITERTEYMNWTFADGVRYPFQLDQLTNGTLTRTVAITQAKAGDGADATELAVAAADIPAPASVQQLSFDKKVPGGPYPGKPAAEIAPGVVQLPNSWYSTIVRQADGLVILDAPISAGYSASVLAEAARRYPGVPVKAVITSTGFFWHVAGVREYAARGIPIYAEARNVPVIQAMLAAPHTLAPDALSRQRAPRVRVIPVTARTVIGKGANAITVYPVAATQPMLMSYISDAHLLHTAEMVQPLGPNGAILFPESLMELTATVAAQGFVPERIIGMHMSPTPWTAVADTLREAGAAMPVAR